MRVLQFEDLLELEDLRRNVLFCDLNSDELQMIEKMSNISVLFGRFYGIITTNGTTAATLV